MPVTYPVELSAPKGAARRARRPAPGGPAPAPVGPDTAPVGPPGGPMAPFRDIMRQIPAPVRPLVPVALILTVGYLAYRLGNRR